MHTRRLQRQRERISDIPASGRTQRVVLPCRGSTPNGISSLTPNSSIRTAISPLIYSFSRTASSCTFVAGIVGRNVLPVVGDGRQRLKIIHNGKLSVGGFELRDSYRISQGTFSNVVIRDNTDAGALDPYGPAFVGHVKSESASNLTTDCHRQRKNHLPSHYHHVAAVAEGSQRRHRLPFPLLLTQIGQTSQEKPRE